MMEKYEKTIEIIKENYFQNGFNESISKEITEAITDPNFSFEKDMHFSFIIPLKVINEGIRESDISIWTIFKEMIQKEYNLRHKSFSFSHPNEFSMTFNIVVCHEQIKSVRNEIEEYFCKDIRATIVRKMNDAEWISLIKNKLIAGHDLSSTSFMFKYQCKSMPTDTIIGDIEVDNFHPKFFNGILSEVIKTQFPDHELAKFLPEL